MFFYLNKIVWFWLNPSMLLIMLTALGLCLAVRGIGRGRPAMRRAGFALIAAALAATWFCSTLAAVCLLGLPLERPYIATQTPDSLPGADAIVVLGGGMGKHEAMPYPDMSDGADRVWHAARLYRAGKAPLVVASGSNDLEAVVPLLVDFGVPRECIVVDNTSRNTYENSRFTEALLTGGDATVRRSVLLVTSAWHMTRSLGNFSRTSLAVTPAAADFKAHSSLYMRQHWWTWIAPTADNFAQVATYMKEWLGRLARR